MKNYICVNGQKIELTEEQVKQICAARDQEKIKLAEIPEGDTFKIGVHEFVVLEHSGDTTAVIRKELLDEDMEFGSNNNFSGSYVAAKCDEFADEIAGNVGTENMVEHTVDLISDDGLKDYGIIKSRCSLLTTNRYRRYVEILDKFKPDRWWWLATAHSTERHGNGSWIKCVSPAGNIVLIDFCYNSFGVRPFCILKSNIFVSK